MKKGLIALDIDGTITAEHHRLEGRVVDYFTKLAAEGWQFIFITGRTFAWGFEVLKTLPFPYYFAVQNGAIILKMPERRIIATKYLDRAIMSAMDEVCRQESSDYVIYAGYEQADVCYFRPKHFSTAILSYVQKRTLALRETWIPLDSYDKLSLDRFASIKCFEKYASAARLARNIEMRLGLHVPLIRDPFDETYFVVQATHPAINKGQALKDLMALTHYQGGVIAAGDDLNDVSMLHAADIKVVMATAPKEVLELAHIIAPSAAEEGIIEGLEKAIVLYKGCP